MTAPMIFTAEYYQRMRDLERDGWWNAAMRDIAAMLLRSASLPGRGTMLDVGCGSGQTMAWFESLYPEWRTVGLDVAAEALAAARAIGARVTRGSGLALPHADQSVDLVITLDVVQHLPLSGGDAIALAEMRRVLRPGGSVLLRTNAQAFPRVADDPVFNFHRYRPGELRAKLRAAGFEVLRLSRVNTILGLAEIPRELRAARRNGDSRYRGILAPPPSGRGWTGHLKRRWLRLEGRAAALGVRLPLGRTIVALCRA